MAFAAGQDVPDRHASRTHRGRCRTETADRHRQAVSQMDRTVALLSLTICPRSQTRRQHKSALLDAQQAFGYTQEDLKFIMLPMATAGEEATGSMGSDAALPVLSSRSKVLYNYFKQLFAQVTNPPIDPIREEIVMSLTSFIGPKPNLLGVDETKPAPRLEVHQPVLSHEDISQAARHRQAHQGQIQIQGAGHHLSGEEWCSRLRSGHCKALCKAADKAVADGYNVLILSDRALTEKRVAIPALLATCGSTPSSGESRFAYQHRSGGRDRLGARSASFCLARRLRRGSGVSVVGLRQHSRDGTARRLAGERRAETFHQGDQQGLAQGDVQDGHLHISILLRFADL